MAKILPFPGTTGDQPDDDDPHGHSDGPDYAARPGENAGSSGLAGSKLFPGLFGKDLGLDDWELSTLVSGDHEQWSELFLIQPELTAEEAKTVPILRWTRALLEEIRRNEPVKATTRGNLPAAMVKRLSQGAFVDAESTHTRVNNETHSPVLMRVRRLAQDAGLLLYRSKVFRVTKAGLALLEKDDHNGLYRYLLHAFLRKPETLEQYDRYPSGSVTVRTLPLMLFAARYQGSARLYEEDFADLLNSVFERHPEPEPYGDELASSIRVRFFERFGVPFGFFREAPPFKPPMVFEGAAYDPYSRWTRTPFFERILRWHVDPPKQPFQTPAMAALNFMEGAHEAPFRINGTENYRIQRWCIRAIERCPDDADAWVVWARLYEHKPEISLEIAEKGLEATADRRPDIPDDLSPWADHLYRDVIRLHFTRAASLLSLDRRDEALAVFEEMLRFDPEDGINAAAYYVPALIEAGRYDEAHRVHEKYRDDHWADGPWTSALIAWARGERDRARYELDRAWEKNPDVAEMLLLRWIPETGGGYYTAGSEGEAVVYAERTGSAWRRVPGARDWLRRQAQSRE